MFFKISVPCLSGCFSDTSQEQVWTDRSPNNSNHRTESTQPTSTSGSHRRQQRIGGQAYSKRLRALIKRKGTTLGEGEGVPSTSTTRETLDTNGKMPKDRPPLTGMPLQNAETDAGAGMTMSPPVTAPSVQHDLVKSGRQIYLSPSESNQNTIPFPKRSTPPDDRAILETSDGVGPIEESSVAPEMAALVREGLSSAANDAFWAGTTFNGLFDDDDAEQTNPLAGNPTDKSRKT